MSEKLYERQVLGKFVTEEEKIVEPLYYNGYISLDERANIREYIKQLQQQLKQRDEVIEETIKIINSWRVKPTSYFKELEGSLMAPSKEVDKLLKILKKYKGDSNE